MLWTTLSRALLLSLITTAPNMIATTPHLFKKFPALQQQIPHVELCDLPTPIVHLKVFGNTVGSNTIFMKRDDLTGKTMDANFRHYGGNKPRKLEFLLADAQKRNAHTIITYGCAGSNHALATADHANSLGFDTILMLKDQPNSHIVRHNLMLDLYHNAQLQWFSNNTVRDAAMHTLVASDSGMYHIPTGGSNHIGTLGFVNAALELQEQIDNGVMPAPDFIYLATGTCATTAGLLLGLRATNNTAKIVGVCVEPEEADNEFLPTTQKLFKETNEYLHSLDATFPLFDFSADQLILNKKYCGQEYGLFLPATPEITKLFKDTENIKLEGTYSAKPVMAIIDDLAAQPELRNATILFWNTYCGIDYSDLTAEQDYKQLPQEFQKYFVEDVQQFDK